MPCPAGRFPYCRIAICCAAKSDSHSDSLVTWRTCGQAFFRQLLEDTTTSHVNVVWIVRIQYVWARLRKTMIDGLPTPA